MAACIPVKSGNTNYGGLKHNSFYLGLVLPSGGWQSLISVKWKLPTAFAIKIFTLLAVKKHLFAMSICTKLAVDKMLTNASASNLCILLLLKASLKIHKWTIGMKQK